MSSLRHTELDAPLELRPIAIAIVKEFVGEHHRHNKPPQGWKFGVGLYYKDELVGVGAAGRPNARMLDNGFTLEITRTCTIGIANGNSRIYGALIKAGKALGYKRIITYTLAREPGSSCKAVGFREAAKVKGNYWTGFVVQANGKVDVRDYDTNVEDKVRWQIDFE